MIFPLYSGSTARSAFETHLSPFFIASAGNDGKLLKLGYPLSSSIKSCPLRVILNDDGIDV